MKNLYLLLTVFLSLNLQVLGKTPICFSKDNPTKKDISVVKNISNLKGECLTVDKADLKFK